MFCCAQPRLFFYKRNMGRWFHICMGDDLFLLLQMQKICLLVRQLGEVFKSGSNVNLIHNVNRNGHLECGEEMLVFCEHYKLCTEETSQVVATEAANCFGDSSAGPKRHSRSKFAIRIGKMLVWIAQYG